MCKDYARTGTNANADALSKGASESEPIKGVFEEANGQSKNKVNVTSYEDEYAIKRAYNQEMVRVIPCEALNIRENDVTTIP